MEPSHIEGMRIPSLHQVLACHYYSELNLSRLLLLRV